MTANPLLDTHPVVDVDVPILSFPDTATLLLDQYGCLNPLERSAELCAEGSTRFYAGGLVYRATTIADKELPSPRTRVAALPPDLDQLRQQQRFAAHDATYIRVLVAAMTATKNRYPEGERPRWCAMHSPTIAVIGDLRWQILVAEAPRRRPETWEVAQLNAALKPLGLVPLPTKIAARQ